MFGPDHGIVCRNEATSDMCVALRMARNATEADFFRPMRSAFSIFRVPKSGFFCEAATKTANGKLGTTPHINNRPPGYTYQL
jgi:hypothetical protein